MIDGLLILLLFQFLGEVLIHLTGLPLPAPVVGMILLLFALMLGAPGMDKVSEAAGALIRHITLLIFPLGVGIVLQWHRYQDNALALAVSVVFGTLIALVLVTLLLKVLLRRSSHGSGGGDSHHG
ncbi:MULTISPECIES: CidA/LrgA family protein [Alloalcanivorax]|jgi:holin-like protein|uniref:CidA/LrgA family protein n=2 Tax=Alloalcanivorax TaxID=3020832 RepID=A0A9Q3W6X7_9GAMM|nr:MULTISPECIES: CidA/LrgA family protein [Alloalcanivorax]ERS10557.1 murein hydrolase transporter LrgA [Alcanivorax sp. PN-3]KYZ86518.1 murein hydrolase transporter LrgA [Alcanivorax sp. KX64203]MBA4722575.1 CidA/LrgA family protein [Alcanivorax sp.]ARB44392.1 murein hydrolase transporter LrgA [Alloalcanivorax xenomutans]MCE7510326.1 CidA/LrgA family protein [Alloalcanivorax xenomutans]|tara:strand:+ start:1450 stop:1824 length:375 start_codon:yes stop_codon:yes gene_type:complete